MGQVLLTNKVSAPRTAVPTPHRAGPEIDAHAAIWPFRSARGRRERQRTNVARNRHLGPSVTMTVAASDATPFHRITAEDLGFNRVARGLLIFHVVLLAFAAVVCRVVGILPGGGPGIWLAHVTPPLLLLVLWAMLYAQPDRTASGHWTAEGVARAGAAPDRHVHPCAAAVRGGVCESSARRWVAGGRGRLDGRRRAVDRRLDAGACPRWTGSWCWRITHWFRSS